MARLQRSVEKEDFWRLVLDEHAASGLSVRAFCKRETLSEASFYFWRRELAIRDPQSSQTPNSAAMIPVRVVEPVNAKVRTGQKSDAEPSRTAAIVEVSVPGGFTLRAHAATDADHITTWLGALLKVAAS